MIRIRLCKDHLDEFVSVRVSGHADYAEYGQDIVCSAVSMLTINTVNSITHLLDIALDPQSDAGILVCDFPRQENRELQEKMQLLLASMFLGIQSLKENYSGYIEYEVIYV